MRAFIIALMFASASAAWGEGATTGLQPTTDTYQARVLHLAEILGGLHSVRSLCDSSGDGHWRDRMQELIRLERPSTDERAAMIERFNAGYAAANAKFSSCTDGARAYAASLARDGQGISRTLAQSVEEATTH